MRNVGFTQTSRRHIPDVRQDICFVRIFRALCLSFYISFSFLMRHHGVSPHPLLAFLPLLHIPILFDLFLLSPRRFFNYPPFIPPTTVPPNSSSCVSIVRGYEKASINIHDLLYSMLPAVLFNCLSQTRNSWGRRGKH